MLTPRENLLEYIKPDGKPEYIVNQKSYCAPAFDPITIKAVGWCNPGETITTSWGYTVSWPEGLPGSFPTDTPGHHVISDITCWREQIQAPDPLSYTDEDWAPWEEMAAGIDRDKVFASADVQRGLWEYIHCLMGIEDASVAFYEEPDDMHDLINYIADWEISYAKLIVARLNPTMVFHCDDWGTQISTMFSPDIFDEFFVPAYKRIYDFWHEHVDLVVHHSDSYAATLVPGMIKAGIDIWQGPVTENNLPELVQEYGGQISFQGGIDNGKWDVEDWSADAIYKQVEKLVNECGTKYLIPSFTAAGPATTYEGAYDAATEAINKISMEIFGACQPE